MCGPVLPHCFTASWTLPTWPWPQWSWSFGVVSCWLLCVSVLQSPQPCFCSFFKKGSWPWHCFLVTFLGTSKIRSILKHTLSLVTSTKPWSVRTSATTSRHSASPKGSRKEGGWNRCRPAGLCGLFLFFLFRRGKSKTCFFGHVFFKNVNSQFRREVTLWDDGYIGLALWFGESQGCLPAYSWAQG